jgi:ABC-2 type transport system ATP-binding protein
MHSAPILRVDQLTHRYSGRTALDRVAFTVAPGEIFGLLGPNGGGKTTLFRLLSTLIPLQEGRIVLDDCSLPEHQTEVRRRIGVVFQSPSLDKKLTVEENLRHQGHLYGLCGEKLRDRIQDLLGRLKLTDRTRDRVEVLSGGLQRRVEIAKGLLHRPQVLILDEPSTGLDPAARRDLWDYLEEANRQDGVTILVTTHLMEEAERCHRLMILDQGRCVACDTPAALKASLGGKVITLASAAPDPLAISLRERLSLTPVVIAGTIRLEVADAAAASPLIKSLVDAFPAEISSLTLSSSSLEDVFIHHTGHPFEIQSPGK